MRGHQEVPSPLVSPHWTGPGSHPDPSSRPRSPPLVSPRAGKHPTAAQYIRPRQYSQPAQSNRNPSQSRQQFRLRISKALPGLPRAGVGLEGGPWYPPCVPECPFPAHTAAAGGRPLRVTEAGRSLLGAARFSQHPQMELGPTCASTPSQTTSSQTPMTPHLLSKTDTRHTRVLRHVCVRVRGPLESPPADQPLCRRAEPWHLPLREPVGSIPTLSLRLPPGAAHTPRPCSTDPRGKGGCRRPQ